MPQAAGILLVAPTGRVLLLRRSDDGSWALPGGMAEPSDPTLLATALRELTEETGFRGTVDAEPHALGRSSGAVLTYWTFGGYVDREFPVRLNPEHTASSWCLPGPTCPQPLHPGVAELFRRLDV